MGFANGPELRDKARALLHGDRDVDYWSIFCIHFLTDLKGDFKLPKDFPELKDVQLFEIEPKRRDDCDYHAQIGFSKDFKSILATPNAAMGKKNVRSAARGKLTDFLSGNFYRRLNDIKAELL